MTPIEVGPVHQLKFDSVTLSNGEESVTFLSADMQRSGQVSLSVFPERVGTFDGQRAYIISGVRSFNFPNGKEVKCRTRFHERIRGSATGSNNH